jgi:hypothetical protein
VIRRLVRLALGPVVRWAANGWMPNYYTVRRPGGAYLCTMGAFYEVYQKKMGIHEAKYLADDLLYDSYNAAEGLPLPPE